MQKREIVDARADEKGNITQVRFKGNQNFTSLDKAIEIADRDGIENAHAVHPKRGAKSHLRTNPDGKKSNNLDEMAES